MLVSGFATSSFVFHNSLILTARPSTPVQHIILVPFENMNHSIVNGTYSALAPYDTYLRALSGDSVSGGPGGIITNYYGIAYTSTPNYLAWASGSQDSYPCDQPTNCGNYSGCPTKSPYGCDLNDTEWNTTDTSIFAQGESWDVFAQNEPFNCYGQDSGGKYVTYIAHHTAAPYYTANKVLCNDECKACEDLCSGYHPPN